MCVGKYIFQIQLGWYLDMIFDDSNDSYLYVEKEFRYKLFNIIFGVLSLEKWLIFFAY